MSVLYQQHSAMRGENPQRNRELPAHERPEKPVAADVGDARSREVKRPLRRRHEVDLSGDRAPPAPWAGDDDQAVARQAHIDALQIVLGRLLYDNIVQHNFLF